LIVKRAMVKCLFKPRSVLIVGNRWLVYYTPAHKIHSISMSKPEHAFLSEIMTTKVVTVDISERVEEALRLMVKFDIGSVIVVDKQKPVGIITERDVTRAALRGDSLLRLPVRSLMSRPLQTATPNTEIWRTFELMLKLGVRRLAIVENDKLVGIVTEKDLTRWVLRIFYEPNLPEELQSLVTNPRVEALTGRPRCPSCGRYQDECICVRTQLATEE
jgi:CBS domain-containing protein